MNRIRTFQLTLQCTLHESEKNQYGLQIAAKHGRIQELDAERKELGEQIKELKDECSTLATSVNQGWEYRMVEVDELENFDQKEMVRVRRDTGQIVSSRPMTDEERQPRLPVEP